MNVGVNEADLAPSRANTTSKPIQEVERVAQARYKPSVEAVPSSVSQYHSPAWVRSLSRTIHHHDPEIVNYFLNLFRVGVTPVFPTFELFQVTESTLADLILAIAAVGGLLSTLEGSFKIARSMYADARRLLFSRVSL